MLTSPDALLRVTSAIHLSHVRVGIYCAEKDGLELIHSSIGKEQSRVIVWDHLEKFGRKEIFFCSTSISLTTSTLKPP